MAKIRLDFDYLLSNANVQAFERVIRQGESSQVDDGPRSAYRARYHPNGTVYETDLSRHPRKLELNPRNGKYSSAFGAFQFTMTTWDDMIARYEGLEDDASPGMQRRFAVALIHFQGALDAVLAGDWRRACLLCGNRWASLPDAALDDGYGHKQAWESAAMVWAKYGGSIPATGPAPIEERDPDGDGRPGVDARPEDVRRIEEQERGQDVQRDEESNMAFPLVPLLLGLVNVFSPVIRQKMSDALDGGMDKKTADEMAAQSMNLIQSTVGEIYPEAKTNAIIATAKVMEDPKVRLKVEEKLEAYYDSLKPMIDQLEAAEERAWQAEEQSRNAAAERAKGDKTDMAPVLAMSGIGMVGALIVFVAAIIGIQVYKGLQVGTEMWAALTGLIGWVTAKVGSIYDYRFGTSRSSSSKDVLIAELSSRRPKEKT